MNTEVYTKSMEIEFFIAEALSGRLNESEEADLKDVYSCMIDFEKGNSLLPDDMYWEIYEKNINYLLKIAQLHNVDVSETHYFKNYRGSSTEFCQLYELVKNGISVQ